MIQQHLIKFVPIEIQSVILLREQHFFPQFCGVSLVIVDGDLKDIIRFKTVQQSGIGEKQTFLSFVVLNLIIDILKAERLTERPAALEYPVLPDRLYRNGFLYTGRNCVLYDLGMRSLSEFFQFFPFFLLLLFALSPFLQ